MSRNLIPNIPVVLFAYARPEHLKRTPIKRVRKLPSGHLLVIDVKPWSVTEHTYWCIEDIPPLEGNPVKLIRNQLDELSALVVRSDVPVGVALSGGMHSSAIAALTARTYPGVLQGFSVGYPGRPSNDERDQAKSLAHSLKIPSRANACDRFVSARRRSNFFQSAAVGIMDAQHKFLT